MHGKMNLPEDNDAVPESKRRKSTHRTRANDNKLTEEAIVFDIGEINHLIQNDNIDDQPKFVPRPPPPRDNMPSPLSKRHTRGPKVIPPIFKG